MEPEHLTSPDGTSIAVWRSGQGRPLVLVHGTSADHGRWAPVLPALEARFTVLSMDRRGRGRSGDAGRYALEREAEDVAAVIDAAGEQVDVLGHSYGAVCALEAAVRTGAIRRLVLYEPPLGFVQSPREVVDRLHARLEAGDREGVVAMFLQEVAGLPPEQVELMRSLPAWEGRVEAAGTIPREEAAEREYTWEPERFRDMRVPTLFLLGGDSPAAFRLAGEAVADALPDCRVVVMPGQRHAAIDTGTEIFTREVLAFLAAE